MIKVRQARNVLVSFSLPPQLVRLTEGMYFPQITAIIPFCALLWLARPSPSVTQQALNYIGLHAYSVGFDVISLAIFTVVACLLDECYRRGAKKLQKDLQKFFFNLDDSSLDTSSAPSASGVSTSTSTTPDSAPIVMSGSMRRCVNAS